jgi:chromate transporter
LCRTDAPIAITGATHTSEFRVPRAAGAVALVLFCVLLFALPALSGVGSRAIVVFDAFYRSGALVFGGGHVVLPLLQQETVATGWVSPNDFLAGYGAAQAVPGPLFTFAAFLGWSMSAEPNRWYGALLAIGGIFLPGLLLVIAALPYWQALRARASMIALLSGVNAAVVGLLATALYSPVWTGGVRSVPDFAIATIAFFLLTRWKTPPLVIVTLCALAGIAEVLLH